jgi:formiminoglutamase
MNYVKRYTKDTILNIIRKRDGEQKIGENVNFFGENTQFSGPDIRFVLFGVPEDVGVRANFGRGGAHTAWKPAFESFLNQQSNSFLTGNDILVLGELEVSDIMRSAEKLNAKVSADLDELRALTTEIDNRLFPIVQLIISQGKIPLVIGGGHNNAYGNIKGSSLALGKKINVINCDPHADLRNAEGRHSGNGFSYALQEDFMERYSLFCMHEQYNTSAVLKEMRENNKIFFSSYEDVFVRESVSYSTALSQNISFVKERDCGIEIDLDAITNVPSSAKTSSGISPVQARQYAYQCGKNLQALYFHVAEAAPILAHLKADNKTGKLIAYLLSDFVKGVYDSEAKKD